MKRLIILTIITTTLLSYPAMAYPQYSEESKKLGQQAGLEFDVPLEEVLSRQEVRKNGQANKTTPNTSEGQEKANKSLKTRNDEYRVVKGGGKNSVKVTDTSDELHIYSNEYNNPTGYSKRSYDEFSIGGKDTPANDGYSKDNFDELHIDPMYQGKLWKPDHEVKRLSIDEIRLPNDPF